MAQKTIVVTGGAGHVGSHVIESLISDPNNKVISLDNYFNGRVEKLLVYYNPAPLPNLLPPRIGDSCRDADGEGR